jgi:hypothetical protein
MTDIDLNAKREELARVIEAGWGNPTWDGKTLRPIDRQIADAVLAAGYVPRAEVARLTEERDQLTITQLKVTLTEMGPADVLVEGSFFDVQDLPKILGNYMRSSSDYARDAKQAHIRAEELQQERDELAAVVAEATKVAEALREGYPYAAVNAIAYRSYVALDTALTTNPAATLAARDAEKKAEGWDEGRQSVGEDLLRPADSNGSRTPTTNPYRATPQQGEQG